MAELRFCRIFGYFENDRRMTAELRNGEQQDRANCWTVKTVDIGLAVCASREARRNSRAMSMTVENRCACRSFCPALLWIYMEALKGKQRMQKRKEQMRLKRIIWTAFALLIMAVVFVFSSQGTNQSEIISDSVAAVLHVEQKTEVVRVSNQPLVAGFSLRKIAHIFLFFLLSFCIYQAMESLKGQIFFSILLSYLYGVFDEVHQLLIGRYARWEDTLIDLIGIILGVCAGSLLPDAAAFLKKRISYRPVGRAK